MAYRFYRYCLNYLRNYGLRRSILSLRNLVLKYIKGTFKKRELIFFEADIEETVSNYHKVCSMNLANIKKSDIEQVQEYNDGWFSKYRALNRLDKGYVLLALTDKNFSKENCHNIIFTQWLEFKKVSIPYIDLSFHIPKDTVYLAYVYTNPAYRGRGIASQEAPIITKYLHECGYKKMFFVIVPKNISSQKVGSIAGGKEYQRATYHKFFFVRNYCITDYKSNQREIVWCIRNRDNNIWRTFSKIQ